MYKAKPVHWEYSGSDWVYGELMWEGFNAYIENRELGCKTRYLIDPATIEEEPEEEHTI